MVLKKIETQRKQELFFNLYPYVVMGAEKFKSIRYGLVKMRNYFIWNTCLFRQIVLSWNPVISKINYFYTD